VCKHAPPPKTSCAPLPTVGACRQTGGKFIYFIYFFFHLVKFLTLKSRAAWIAAQLSWCIRTHEKRAQAHAAENKNETRRRAACRRRSEVDVPLGGWFFVKIVVADIACLPAPENVKNQENFFSAKLKNKILFYFIKKIIFFIKIKNYFYFFNFETKKFSLRIFFISMNW
jgi:hypothetical protein